MFVSDFFAFKKKNNSWKQMFPQTFSVFPENIPMKKYSFLFSGKYTIF